MGKVVDLKVEKAIKKPTQSMKDIDFPIATLGPDEAKRLFLKLPVLNKRCEQHFVRLINLLKQHEQSYRDAMANSLKKWCKDHGIRARVWWELLQHSDGCDKNNDRTRGLDFHLQTSLGVLCMKEVGRNKRFAKVIEEIVRNEIKGETRCLD